jgi:predicted nucleotidyltransferase
VGDGSIRTRGTADWFKVSERKAGEIMRALRARGWLEPSPGIGGREHWYQRSVAGNAFALARAVAPIARAKADQLLKEFLKRVEDVNARDELLWHVGEVRVFGSYLNGKAKDFGDIDLGVEFVPHGPIGPERSKRLEERARQSGRLFRDYLQRLVYPEIEVRQLLKARSPYISIHPMQDIEQTGAKSRVIYRRKAKNRRP